MFGMGNGVSTRSRPKAAGGTNSAWLSCGTGFQLAAARRRLDRFANMLRQAKAVSTRSRPKAAGLPMKAAMVYSLPFQLTAARRRLGHRRRGQRFSVRFNSQPPEGGWSFIISSLIWYVPFQLTAARRRLGMKTRADIPQVHGFQLTAARRRLGKFQTASGVAVEFQLTAARRRLETRPTALTPKPEFQLTAARRRLMSAIRKAARGEVSTHSRPKAAGCQIVTCQIGMCSFNSQPPEGGWDGQNKIDA